MRTRACAAPAALARALRAVSLLLAATTFVAGCRDRVAPAPRSEAANELIDVSSSLEAIRSDFNAHKDRSRFLTLLAPT